MRSLLSFQKEMWKQSWCQAKNTFIYKASQEISWISLGIFTAQNLSSDIQPASALGLQVFKRL